MILRKPYAFFIKHFRFFHFLMFVFLVLIGYKTNLVRTFFNDYLNEIAYIIPQGTANEIFDNLTYVWILIVILFSIIVFIVMNKKEKPVLFYGLNILVLFSTAVYLIYSQVIVHRLQSELISVTILRAVRDIGNLIFIVQAVFLLITFIRAVGFDIMKFDFKKDLEQLDIKEEDNEEYEVQINFDKNEFKRRFKKNVREFKYFLLENKKVIVLFSTLFILGLTIFLYLNFWKYSKTYSLNKYFNTSDFSMKITDSFITSTDYKNDNLTENTLVIVRIETKRSNSIINTSKTQLVVDDNIYYPTLSKYSEYLIDLGIVYDNQKLSGEINKYMLVYEIPRNLKDEKMTFVYLNDYSKTIFGEKHERINVGLNSINLDSNKKQINSQLEKTIEFDNYTISGNLTIMDYEIRNMFVNIYNTCISKTECYDLNQYLQPSFTGYQDKTILKMNAVLNYNEDSFKKYDLIELISKYGKIVYVLDDKTYETKDMGATNFSIVKDEKNYYLEIPQKLENASKIDIVINIRNNEYIYNLK